MKDERGFPTIPGGGRRFTMVAGIMTMCTAGSGFPTMNGVQRGYRGEDHLATTVGRR